MGRSTMLAYQLRIREAHNNESSAAGSCNLELPISGAGVGAAHSGAPRSATQRISLRLHDAYCRVEISGLATNTQYERGHAEGLTTAR
jgi:hypothetical protein